MFDPANDFLTKHPELSDQLIRRYLSRKNPLLLRDELVTLLEEFCQTDDGNVLNGSALYDILCASQEAVVHERAICFAIRWSVARWSYVEFRTDTMMLNGISAAGYLRAKERVLHDGSEPEPLLEIDLNPFERGFPRLREIRSIGHGAEYLNRYLSSRLFQELDSGGQRLFQFLSLHQTRGIPLMLNKRIGDLEVLRDALRSADSFLAKQPPGSAWSEIAEGLSQMGFEPGWGGTVERVRETMGFLSDILEAPLRTASRDS